MAFNNPFPQTYQPMPYPQLQNQQANQSNNNLIWVQGEAGAKSYLLAPNTTIPLWDSESQTIYLKSADASGMPSMKVLDYTIRDAVQAQPVAEEPVDYVTVDEFRKFEKSIRSQIQRLKKEGGHESRTANADGNANKK